MKTKEESVKTAQLNTRNQSVGWSLSRMDDSLNSSSVVVIWPKGEFSFSPSGGFSGMAEKIEITGAIKSGRKLTQERIGLKEQSRDISLKEENTKAITAAQKDTIKERFPVSGWWWVLLLIPLLLGLRWLFSTGKWNARQKRPVSQTQ
ncbi:hypothetical protein OQX61_20310 [Pedobacter sp. PLR]|uniref:hypothetical protein n=1 Tax=Pedobacter sp. PLR TaxID=2994465 RepID=UPI00224512EB|nr:hypothetical protein [Pedobacter sp. PLR]MCX2453626.1 hypothetical protein [Pedobacter sp. PLR]